MNTKVKQNSEPNPKEEIKKQANKMAVFFNAHFTDKELILWQIKASSYLFDYYNKDNSEHDKLGADFITSFEYVLFPELFDAKSPNERIKAIEKEIVFLFNDLGYKGSKEALAEIGKAFLENFERFSGSDSDEQLLKFMKYLSYFMHLCEMFSYYEFWDKQEAKQQKLIAA